MVLTWAALAAFLIWWLQPDHIPSNFIGRNHGVDVVLFVLLTATFAHRLFMDGLTWILAGRIRREEVPPSPAAGLARRLHHDVRAGVRAAAHAAQDVVGDAGGRISA